MLPATATPPIRESTNPCSFFGIHLLVALLAAGNPGPSPIPRITLAAKITAKVDATAVSIDANDQTIIENPNTFFVP
jgi:hypothetical protein